MDHPWPITWWSLEGRYNKGRPCGALHNQQRWSIQCWRRRNHAGTPWERKGANNQQKDVVEQIDYNFRANFAKDDNELDLTNQVEHNIDTSDNAPIKLPNYKTTPAKLAEIKKQVQQMLDLDIIQTSKSDWSAPVILAGKKDGTSSFSVDFRKLNAITKKRRIYIAINWSHLWLIGRGSILKLLGPSSGLLASTTHWEC